MELYRYYKTNEAYDYEDAIEFICEEMGITFDDTTDIEILEKQAELKEVLLEAYFSKDETEEDEDMWENDLEERLREYREMQGF